MIMSMKLRIVLLIFSIIWLLGILLLVKQKKLSIRNSLIWFFAGLIIFVIAVFPFFIESVAKIFGFLTISNLVIGIFITLLSILTLSLTIIVTKQKEQIRNLVQEVSLLKSEKEKK